jgi:2-oxo-4-hydroxy-4-carboxy-5-ureidoimidazoline decarboxylase
MTDNKILDQWNGMSRDEAAAAILPCNGSQAWAARLAELRPFTEARALFAASDSAWSSLGEREWQQAFDSHPRIGERNAKAATMKSVAWSDEEQAKASPDAATMTELAEANRAYEEKFGRIFIVCATGKSAVEMLKMLERRLGNDAGTELHEAAEQQRQITQFRLRKWLEMPVEKN